MAWVIVHKYIEQDLNDLKASKNADCCNCLMSEKTKFSDGSGGYLCKASLYDIKTLACFVPKEDYYEPQRTILC